MPSEGPPDASSEGEWGGYFSNTPSPEGPCYDFGVCRIPDLDVRQPSRSMGAREHPGNCLPCAFQWTQSGCREGEECSFCHMCPQGTIQLKRKTYQKRVKETRKAHRNGDDSSSSRSHTTSASSLSTSGNAARRRRRGGRSGHRGPASSESAGVRHSGSKAKGSHRSDGGSKGSGGSGGGHGRGPDPPLATPAGQRHSTKVSL